MALGFAKQKQQALHRYDNPAKRLALAKALWGWEPHDTQLPWLLNRSDVKCAACGRRWGKTESAIVDDVTFAITHPRSEQMVIAPSRDQVMLLFRPAKDILEGTEELIGAVTTKETPHPEIKIGDSIIRYRTSGEDGKFLRGYKSTRVRIDEAGYVKERIIKDVIQPQLADYNGQLICQGTPFGKNWFYDYFDRGLELNARHSSFTFPTTSNPHLSEEYIEGIRKELGEDSLCWRAEYCAEFVDSMGAVFPWEEIQACLYDHSTAPPFQQYLCGIDPAMYTDFTAVIVGGSDRGLLYVVDWDRFNRVGWKEQKQRIYDTVTRYNAVSVMDATRGSSGDPVAYDLSVGEWVQDGEGRVLHREGLLIDQFDFRNKNKAELIKKMQVRLAHKLYRIPASCQELITEMKYFGFERTESGNVKYAAIGKHNDDMVCALALMTKLTYGNQEKKDFTDGYPPGSLGALYEQLESEERLQEQMIIQPIQYKRF